MRLALISLAAVVLLAGCVDAGIEAIEDARERRQDREPEESTELREPEPFGPPTPTRAPTPTPASPPVSVSPTTPPPVATPLPTPQPPTPATPPPAPTPVSPSPAPAPWPTSGSYVRLEIWEADGTRAWANWTYAGSDWTGRCESGEGSRDYRARDPPHWPLFNTRDALVVGGELDAWYVDECRIRSLDATYAGAQGGRHYASADGFATTWDDRTGLVLAWERGTAFGRLAATDAPLG